MKVDVLNIEGKKVDTTELPSPIFEAPIREDLMHQAFVRQLANARLGTHSTKSRGEVAGGGAKPWRQKGTGRARHGSRRSPIWVGGGKTHTPKPRDYRKKMPRKMRRAALRSALSLKVAENSILFLDELKLEDAKTERMVAVLKNLTGDETTLVILSDSNENIERSIRNIPEAKTLRANYLNVRDLLHFDRVIMPLDAIEVIQSYLGV
jgi:large subunit ribosomal protein L4